MFYPKLISYVGCICNIIIDSLTLPKCKMITASCYCSDVTWALSVSNRRQIQGLFNSLSMLVTRETPISCHDDVIKWKHSPRNWPFMRGIHRSPVNSLHKGQWRGALMFPLICVWINGWINNRKAGDLRRYRTHYDVTVMITDPWVGNTLVIGGFPFTNRL